MSILDYHPVTGIWRELNGTATDSSVGGGGDSFIDKATGQELTGAYFACGACDYVPIREGDGSCPGCGETVDWGMTHPDSYMG